MDFVVAVCNCCCYSTNRTHGSDAGLRDVWGPVFDRYQVDLVISGHVHAYERTHPIRGGRVAARVPSGGVVDPATQGTTYICAGGGGNSLYTGWYGDSDGGTTRAAGRPMLWRWTGGQTARGGSGRSENVPDPVTGFSAYRRAAFSVLLVDVRAPRGADRKTALHIRAVAPRQTPAEVYLDEAAVMDSVTLVRASPASPAKGR